MKNEILRNYINYYNSKTLPNFQKGFVSEKIYNK